MSTPSDELVERVIEVTGASSDEAKHLLGACNNDVESAVALYFEQGSGVADIVPTSDGAAVPDAFDDEDNVRAPIAPRREQLIGPEDDNFLAAPSLSATGRMQRMNQRVKICPFRDFAREGELMEEQLQADVSGLASTSNGINGRRWASTRAASMVTTAATAQSTDSKPSTSSRLGDLFRPPTDIAFAGTFQAGRARATALSRWLLVNVQDDNFNSQVLNRDVWANKDVRQVIKRRFLLWQIDADTSEGRRFVTFYHCANLPYVCVVDPRTGEEMWKCNDPKESNVLSGLREYISEHKEFSDDATDDSPSTSKRTITLSDDEQEAENSAEKKKRLKLLDLTEEEQINLAIRNSMRESSSTNGKSKTKNTGNNEDGGADDSSEFESAEEFGDEDSKSAYNQTIISYEKQLGQATNELTAIRLRLLNAEGNDEVVQLRWPSDTLLKVLRLYIGEKHSHVIKNGGTYKLICAFPRKMLEAEHDSSTIKELGLHPSANLHITLDE
ncbi:PREDICTED: UBX domain-containing protein 7-like [Rhagoletis zephyria]|uniref:UBX domain-containing protein 7-like n=1 Tax=Rhagoletis zephyria TaxID=28612 RepID=UPI0008117A96|nr:PREDICTED: UBX domain-containing protein 7-like [Rhagoletis zephyria]